MPLEAPSWLSAGDTSWQLTAATLVGLMSVPGLAVLYGGVMQKRWSINSMMLVFATFSIVLLVWVLWAFKMGFGHPFTGVSHGGFFGNFIGKPGPVLGHTSLQHQANIPLIGSFAFPQSALVYFQFVFAAITPILALGSVLGRVNFKAWIPFCVLWITCVYAVDAFLIWGGGFFAQHGAVDFSGGYVIHLSAGRRRVRRRGGDRPAPPARPRDRRAEQRRDGRGRRRPAVARMERLQRRRPVCVEHVGRRGDAEHQPLHRGRASWSGSRGTTSRAASRRMIGGVNGMIIGLVAITPAAGYVNGWGAIAIGVIASTLVYFALNYLSRLRPFRNVDDTLGVIYTHGFAGLAGGLLVGVFADPHMALFYKTTGHGLAAAGSVAGLIHGNATLIKWQFLAAAVGDLLDRGDHVPAAEARRPVHPAADVREEHGARRRRGARPRGVPVRRPVARVPGRHPERGAQGARRCRPRHRQHDDSGLPGWEAPLSASRPTPLAIVSRAVAGDDGLERVACAASDALGDPVVIVLPSLGAPVVWPADSVPAALLGELVRFATAAAGGAPAGEPDGVATPSRSGSAPTSSGSWRRFAPTDPRAARRTTRPGSRRPPPRPP